jgi:hypothetical protein
MVKNFLLFPFSFRYLYYSTNFNYSLLGELYLSNLQLTLLANFPQIVVRRLLGLMHQAQRQALKSALVSHLN